MERKLKTREISNMKEIEEEEEEEMICRICHGPGDSENPLQYPCACSGTIKFVHPKCLLHWMKQQITFECEVCKHKYSLHRFYAESTPTRLPLREFVGGIAEKVCHVLHFCLRFCVSVFYQLFMVPLIAFWIWRLSFVRSLFEARELVRSHLSPSAFMMDWLYGLVICNVLFTIWVYGFDFIREDDARVARAPAPSKAALGLRLLVALLRSILRVMITVFKLDVPVRRTCIHLVKATILFLITNGVVVLVPFSLGRITLHWLSWIFFAASSIFMPFIESAFYIVNNSLKNASHTGTNLSAEIQNGGLLSYAKEVVAETLTANRTGPGEALSSVGKPVLVYRCSGLYDAITLATGYVVMPLVFVCFGIPIRTVASKIRYNLRKFVTTMIYPFFLIIHLGVLPLVYGWWLDVCTVTMLGKSISDRVEFLSKFPLLSSLMHWTTGFVYKFLIHISTSQVQRVLRKEVLYFLQDLADPIYTILRVIIDDVQVQSSQFLFSIVVNGILIVFLVYLPVVLAKQLAPAIFHLHISVSDPFTEILVVMLLFHICLRYAIELRKTVEALLNQWVTAVCCILGLSGFLYSRPEDISGQENVEVERRQDRLRDRPIAAQDPNQNISTSQKFDGVESCASDAIDNGCTFALRVMLLVVLAWITFLLFSSSLIIISLPLGRVLFSSFSNLPITHGIKRNDLYAFFIGNFSIWTSLTGARYFTEHFKAGNVHLLFSDSRKLFCIIVKSCVLLSLWIIVIPALVGLLFEFSFMVPIQALVVEAPALVLCQDWAVGFFIFELWKTLVLRNHRIVLVDESWRVKLERVRDNDILKLPGRWMLQEILLPIIMNLLMSLCLPYMFARWIVLSLGFSQIVSSTVCLFTWIAYVTIFVLFSCAKRFPVWLTNLHNSVRDDRYYGLGLQNFGEASLESNK